MAQITRIEAAPVAIPLVKPFKTALRVVTDIDYILVQVHTNAGLTGLGGAAPSAVITGDTKGSILAALDHISDCIAGMDLTAHEQVLDRLNTCMVGNTSAKAAVDMAVYDLAAKAAGQPLFAYLGGGADRVPTDYTICIDDIQTMETESRQITDEGFKVLKIKVGHDPREDIRRLLAVSRAVGPDVPLRIDANQGWTAKQALAVADACEHHQLNIQLMEQPVKAWDFKGLAFVRNRTRLPVFADESLFSSLDALRLLEMEAVDGFNIKLMKCGGIYNALKIADLAKTAGIPCMIGSMMEANVSVTAAAHLAAARPVICYADLDAPLYCSVTPVDGGMGYAVDQVCLGSAPGLGFRDREG